MFAIWYHNVRGFGYGREDLHDDLDKAILRGLTHNMAIETTSRLNNAIDHARAPKPITIQLDRGDARAIAEMLGADSSEWAQDVKRMIEKALDGGA